MACGFKCPFAERRNQYTFLMCKGLMDKDTDYNIQENAFKAFCAHQYHCPKSNRAETTQEAKKCYEYLSAKAD